jgi:hypothetical protein
MPVPIITRPLTSYPLPAAGTHTHTRSVIRPRDVMGMDIWGRCVVYVYGVCPATGSPSPSVSPSLAMPFCLLCIAFGP